MRLQQFLRSPQTLSYDTLPECGEQIRLLKIKSGKQHKRIVCELTTFSLAEAPRYAAISYTWGDPSRLRYVRINDRNILVRQSCYWALLQARLHDIYEYIWIDAICG